MDRKTAHIAVELTLDGDGMYGAIMTVKSPEDVVWQTQFIGCTYEFSWLFQALWTEALTSTFGYLTTSE
jgi:hypothetical protein